MEGGGRGFEVGFLAGAAVTVLILAIDEDTTFSQENNKEPTKTLINKGFLTKEQVKAAAQKGIGEVVAVASQQFPSEVNGLPVDTRKLAQDAVEAYLSGDRKDPPVVTVPATPAP